MRDLTIVRRELAEKGIEMTPKELTRCVKKIKKIHRCLAKGPDMSDITLWDRQEACRIFASQGKEVSLNELDELLEIGYKIQQLDF